MIDKLRFGILQTTLYRLGHIWFDRCDYNLNLIGIRSKNNASNAFNDLFCVTYRVNTVPHCHLFKATTDPGHHWLLSPMNASGTAVMQAGQTRGLWKIGRHQDRYEALVQNKPVTVIRDNNRDRVVNIKGSKTQTGMFGINCHRARVSGESKQVDKWSAGCQVLANADDFTLLMALCRKSASLHGNSFTYTLINEVDLWNP